MRGYSRPASTIQAVELLSLHINHLKSLLSKEITP